MEQIGSVFAVTVQVRAVQLTRDADWEAIARWCGGELLTRASGQAGGHLARLRVGRRDTRGQLDWWVIRGVTGEFFLRDPDAFAAAGYKPAEPLDLPREWPVPVPTEVDELLDRVLEARGADGMVKARWRYNGNSWAVIDGVEIPTHRDIGVLGGYNDLFEEIVGGCVKYGWTLVSCPPIVDDPTRGAHVEAAPLSG